MFEVSKWVMRAHFRHLRSKKFSMIYGMFQSNGFWPFQLLSEDLGIHRDSNSQNGSSLESVSVHSLTLSYTPGSMRCDSHDSFLDCTLASPCLGREPKAKVATKGTNTIFVVVDMFLKLVKFAMTQTNDYFSTCGFSIMAC